MILMTGDGIMLKRAAFVLALTLSAGAAGASGLNDPVVEQEIILQDAASSSAPSASLVLALTTIIVFSAAASN